MEDRWYWVGNLLLAVCTAVSLISYAEGYQEAYSISQISPNSASNQEPNSFTSERENEHSLKTSAVFYEEVINIKPSDKLNELLSDDVNGKDGVESPHIVVVRSAAPILRDLHVRSKKYEDLISENRQGDSVDTNDVEIHNQPSYYNQIQPTKTRHQASSIDNDMVSSAMTSEKSIESGEAKGVPRGRALTPKGPRSMATATTQTSATSLRFESVGRQSNPDIQDIITGIVKLLNGNVNVQANTQPANTRPSRPSGTRINNRGPPRISDVPPLPPDFDTPGPAGPIPLKPPLPPQPSTKIPPPYPFDRPPLHEQTPVRPFINGIPLPEQIVPIVNNQNYRPNGFPGSIRPQNIPPWQRPRPRPPTPNRRPNPNLPMYKPQPSILQEPPTLSYEGNEDEEFFTTAITRIEEPLLKPKPNRVELEGMNHNIADEIQNGDYVSTVKAENQENNPITAENFTQNPVIADGENFVPVRDPPVDNNTTDISSYTTKEIEIQNENFSTTVEPETQSIPTKQEILKDSENNDKKKQNMIKSEKEKPTSNKKQEDKLKDGDNKNKNSSQEDSENIGSNSSDIFSSAVLEPSMVETNKQNDSDSVIDGLVILSSTPTDGLKESISVAINSVSSSEPNSVSSTIINTQPSSPPQQSFPYQPYKPRPGIVLDDTEYRPVGGQSAGPIRRPLPAQRPPSPYGEIFDVTVSAIQGPNNGNGLATVQIESVNPLTGQHEDIIISPSGDQGFVSIDGKRTYLNLFGDGTPTQTIHPTTVQKSTVAVTGTGYVVPEVENAPRPVRPQPPRLTSNPPIVSRKPHQPPIRIDTCIVGDDSTCDQTQNERCKTEAGISSCHCRPGYAKRKHRDPCRKIVAMVFSLRVDKMYDRKVTWDEKLKDKESESYQKLSFEAIRAVDSAFSMTPYSDEFVSGSVNTIYSDLTKNTPGVYVNVTILLEESSETLRGNAGTDISRHLLGVIQRRSNNIGASALWVEHPSGSISRLYDLDECSSPELNDCHEIATCTNIWGSFKCECPAEAKDAWADQPNRAGRHCHTCPSSHCSNRGTCSYRGGQPVCTCNGAYYGSQCEVDGEVVGVAVGSSLAALVVILITLACLVMWSRRWSREQKTANGLGSPVFGYIPGGGIKNPGVVQSPYQVTLEERMRWAQLADVMAQANHYAQPEPMQAHPGARPQSAMYGAYPTLSVAGTLPPVPMPRLGLHMTSSTLHLNQTGTLSNVNNTLASRANTLTGLGHTFGGLSTISGNHGTESTSSESDSHTQDRADLLGSRNFHVPRPKSRSNATNSIANQSGIYYDVDYENAPDPIYGTKGIPLSTYTMNRGMPFYRQ